MISKSEYKRLEEQNQELIYEVERYKRYCENRDDEKSNLNNECEKLRRENIQYSLKANRLELENKELLETINYLVRKKCTDGTVEFAALKTYQKGWISLFLHGEELNVGDTNDVTIYSEPGRQPVTVSING